MRQEMKDIILLFENVKGKVIKTIGNIDNIISIWKER